MESAIANYQQTFDRLAAIRAGATVHLIQKIAPGITRDICGVFMGQCSDEEYNNFALLGPANHRIKVWKDTSIVIDDPYVNLHPAQPPSEVFGYHEEDHEVWSDNI